MSSIEPKVGAWVTRTADRYKKYVPPFQVMGYDDEGLLVLAPLQNGKPDIFEQETHPLEEVDTWEVCLGALKVDEQGNPVEIVDDDEPPDIGGPLLFAGGILGILVAIVLRILGYPRDDEEGEVTA